tara:strand:+ start:1450 stop:1710 length:261 start_codon:yes stop_codon:yes gene_type:complete
MPFKKKPYRKVGDIYLPRPPTGATHIFFQSDDKKRATVAIKDVDTLLGSVGAIKYLKLNNRNKLVKTFDREYHWDGEKVEGLNHGK